MHILLRILLPAPEARLANNLTHPVALYEVCSVTRLLERDSATPLLVPCESIITVPRNLTI